MRRLLSLHLYRCLYYETMKPWERKLYDWGLLGYIACDVIGAHQEESFGIRQNHRFYLNDWDKLIRRHFAAHQFELFVPERGWGESAMKRLAIRLDPYRSVWRAARLLGGTVAAICRKAGKAVIPEFDPDGFERHLRCPDCGGDLSRGQNDSLSCGSCGFAAPNDGSVYNLLPSTERNQLYPGERPDVIDFCLPGHDKQLRRGWYGVEGVFGAKYRWMGSCASAVLERVDPGPQRLRIRGHAPEQAFRSGKPVQIGLQINGSMLRQWTLDRSGLFVLEADVPELPVYQVDMLASPEWSAPNDERSLTVHISMLRLVPVEE
jgi:hypothetical protein